MARPLPTPPPRWHRHFFYRKESLKTTWKLRFLVLFLVVAGAAFIWGFGTPRIARSLVCAENSLPSDALLLENFDPNYLVFERAEALRREGVAARILVPTSSDKDGKPSAVAQGTVELMAKVAWIPNFEIIPIQPSEPISLNAAEQIKDFLAGQGVKSVVVVAPAFRSRRSALVYDSVLAPAGIRVGCVPVFGTTNPDNWTETWHGIQDVAEQFLKLQYYRLYVLR
jgi:hypothetical protein